ncbi:MAG: lysophospholipid acyltransferase family protein [Saprospiraceae bacterium]
MTYFFFRVGVFIIRLLPFFLLYRLADLITFMLHRIFHYRQKVILSNLKNSFPNHSEQQLKKLLPAIYRNLADILLEGIKGMTMPLAEMKKRYHVTNPEVLDESYQNGQSVLLSAAHYGNWEWTVCYQHVFKHNSAILYKPLKNKQINQFTLNARSRFGTHLRSITDTRPMLNEFGEPSLYVFISDQTPSNLIKADWVDFLNQDTPCLQGLDRHARRMKIPVFYSRLKRVKRGFYEIELVPLCLQPQQTEKGEITKLYMAALEEQIREEAAPWLWSHKRWKHGRAKLARELEDANI